MRMERSVLLKRKNNMYHLHILFYMQGSSLLIRSECLLLLIIIIIIIIFRVGREYRIYSIKRERERKGNKGNKSCPKYDKVRIGKIFEIVCQIKGKICYLCYLLELSAQKTLVEYENQKAE